MRLILFLFTYYSSVSLFAQSPLISKDFNQASVEEVFATLSTQTQLLCYYNPEWTDSLQFTAKFDKIPLTEVLDELFLPHKIHALVTKEAIWSTSGQSGCGALHPRRAISNHVEQYG